ncbi:MAG: trimethylamine methyltransferase family protein [Actinobacteria bacterium]|nr:trimethylamine methyltransferase family protein [Actinomycetota bacterium]
MIKSEISRLEILGENEIRKIKDGSACILNDTGVRINNDGMLAILAENDIRVDFKDRIAKFPEEIIYKYISLANSKFTLYGRDLGKRAEFGYGKTNILSSSGQFMFYDWEIDERRKPATGDLMLSATVASNLENIDIVGPLVVPGDIDPKIRDIRVAIDLLNSTDKPVAFWLNNGDTVKYILEIMEIIRDGQGELKKYPFCECFIEAISPLQFTNEGIEILKLFAGKGLPIGFGPMAMQGATAPVTIAGTIAQENAEILAGIIISQVLNPGNPVTYWGIPHCMDMATGNMSFGSPEQGLLAAGLVQVARSYGFRSVGVNLGLTDSNLYDFQNGFEKGVTAFQGIQAGADILGHQGIKGADSCGSIPQLILDNEYLSYLKRYFRGFKVSEETINLKLINEAGIGGNFLAHPNTVKEFRNEVFIPYIFNRDSWDTWSGKNRKSAKDIAISKMEEIRNKRKVEPVPEDKMKEISRIFSAAQKELSG